MAWQLHTIVAPPMRLRELARGACRIRCRRRTAKWKPTRTVSPYCEHKPLPSSPCIPFPAHSSEKRENASISNGKAKVWGDCFLFGEFERKTQPTQSSSTVTCGSARCTCQFPTVAWSLRVRTITLPWRERSSDGSKKTNKKTAKVHLSSSTRQVNKSNSNTLTHTHSQSQL